MNYLSNDGGGWNGIHSKDSSGDGANGSGDLVVPLGFELPTTIRDMKIINNESVEFTITLPLSVMQEIMEKARH